jgi:transcriptional regulator with XRE-family HTH domain
VDVYFRKQLRQERVRRGWSQADVAKKLSRNGIPMYATTVAKIEAGERAVRVDEAAAIADLLELPLDWLLGRQAAGPESKLRYALHAVQEGAHRTMADLASMLEALRHWGTDTFELSFDGKDEFDADIKATAGKLYDANVWLARLVTFELPGQPMTQFDREKFTRLVEEIDRWRWPFDPVRPKGTNIWPEVSDETQS